jgi:predicted metal-dependent hydrolase
MPAEQFQQAIAQFNQGEFYACHDTLEAIWIEAPEPERNFYQGLLQIAVGIYHLSNLNWRGALILLGEGIRRLQPYQPDHAGIDVESVVDDSAQLLSALQLAGTDGMVAIVSQLNLSNRSEQSNPQQPAPIEAQELDLHDLKLPKIRKLKYSNQGDTGAN